MEAVGTVRITAAGTGLRIITVPGDSWALAQCPPLCSVSRLVTESCLMDIVPYPTGSSRGIGKDGTVKGTGTITGIGGNGRLPR
jgi:hypothetical protein